VAVGDGRGVILRAAPIGVALPSRTERLMSDIYDIAKRVFGTVHGGVKWPYSLSDNSCDRAAARKEGLEAYNSWCAEQAERQKIITEWAVGYGLRANYTDPCPRWITRKSSRRCSYDDCLWSHEWRDHSVCWTLNRVPVAFTSAPYSSVANARKGAAEWVDQNPNTDFAIGTGWYGYRTIQVLVWRTDRIEKMVPAGYDII
jgi:hypothetical protein